MEHRNPVALSACILAVACPAAGPGPLRFTGKVGEVHKYHLVSTLVVNDTKIAKTLEETLTVIKICRDGRLVIREVTDREDVKAEDQETKQLAPPEVVEYASDNTFVKALVTTEDHAVLLRDENLLQVQLPSTTLSIGKTWSRNIATDTKTGAVKMEANYKVIGSEVVAGIPCWKISDKSKELEGETPGSMDGTFWISKADAWETKAEKVVYDYPLERGNVVSYGKSERVLVK